MDKAPSKGLVSSSVNNDSNLKRKINESNSDDDDAEVFKHKPSETDLNKKLKQITKPTKIQVNLASSGLKASLTLKSKTPIIETNKQTIIETEKLKPINAKLPTGNLAPSNNKQTVLLKNVSEKVAKVFGSDDDDDNDREEMPLEAKMKMKNVGRNTPTSQGPNSYGKTILGFCDSRKLFEKQLKEKADQLLREEESEANK